jgi:hypothetical protein
VRVLAPSPLQSGLTEMGAGANPNGDGASDFEALSSALRQRPHSIILYAFDLLHLDGKDLRKVQARALQSEIDAHHRPMPQLFCW